MTDRDGPHGGPYAGKGPRSWTPGDERLLDALSDRLAEDRLLDARGIEVAVDGGRVTLSGEVPGASDIAQAEMLARATPGVTQVVNRLSFHPGPRAVDKLAPEPEPLGLQGRWGRFVPPFIT